MSELILNTWLREASTSTALQAFLLLILLFVIRWEMYAPASTQHNIIFIHTKVAMAQKQQPNMMIIMIYNEISQVFSPTVHYRTYNTMDCWTDDYRDSADDLVVSGL